MPGRASAATDSKIPDALHKAMQGVMDTLFAQIDEDGRDISEVFHDLIPKRSLPDYYKVIKNPMAMNPVQTTIKKRNYASFATFVRDCAQIFYNAKYYNTTGSQIYEDAVTMEGVLESELKKLKGQGIITEADAQLPDFGPIPPPSSAGSQGSPDLDEDSADDEEDDEEDEEGDKKRKPRRSRIGKREITIDDEDEVGKKEVDQRRKRGRPPKVDTPMECRIKNIMKGLRRCRDDDGNNRMNVFEKLPDTKQFPEYYKKIDYPIALDNIRKRIKRREYKSIEQFEADVRLMCENAKTYYGDDSRISQDAIVLLEELGSLVEAEKARGDSEFLRKFPSPNAHLLPPNAIEDDPLPEPKLGAEKTPSIVGAVLRRRKGANDSPPPEPSPPPQPPLSQIPAPIVKPTPAPVEVPSADYHEDLSMAQMYKQAHSHLAASSPAPQQTPQPPITATSTQQMHHRPSPQHVIQTPMTPQYSQQGHNTPLIRQSSVHQPYTPVPVAHTPSPHMYPQQHHIPQNHQPTPQIYSNHQQYPLQAPMQPQVMHHPVPHHTGVYSSPQMQHPQYQPSTTPQAHQQYAQQFNPHQHQTQQYTSQLPHQHRAPTQASISQPPQQPNTYLPPQLSPSTFTLPESTTSGIPESIAEQFLRDDEGRILWFTVPPLETPTTATISHVPVATASAAKAGPSHSLEYLACRQELLARKRRRRQERERERTEFKKRREDERRKELISARAALGATLKVLRNQLSV